MSELYNVSASPHVRSKESTKTIMADVAIALIPAGLFGIYNFGLKALIIILVSVATCIFTEYIYQKKMNIKITIFRIAKTYIRTLFFRKFLNCSKFMESSVFIGL